MVVKITSKRQVTFPARVLDALAVGPGDRLELEEGPDGFLLRPRRIVGWIASPIGALLILVAAVPVMSTAAAQDRRLQLASTEWSPFTAAPGQPRFALDLVEAALERMGIGVDTVMVESWPTLIPALLSGEFDGSAAVWRDAERDRALLYSQPYLENRLVLVGRRGSDVSATALADLADARVALIAGYAYGVEVEAADGPIFVGSDSKEESVARLLAGEVDYTLMDDVVVQYLVTHHGDEARTRLAFGSTPLLTRSLHFAVRRSLPDAESIVARFNAELRGMIVDGSYHRLLHLDWIRADVDGDGHREYVARDDRVGPHPPEHSYTLFAAGSPAAEPGAPRRFYFGGDVYEGWSAVPERYKAPDFSRPEPRRHTARIFTFTW